MILHLAQSAAQGGISTDMLAVPLGAAATVLVTIIGTAWKLIQVINKITTKFDHLEGTVTEMKNEMKARWSRKDQEIFQLQLQLYNKDIRVPGVPSITESRTFGGAERELNETHTSD